MENSNKAKKYELSTHRFLELYYYCLQYKEWKEELEANQDTMKSVIYDGMPRGYSGTDATQNLAIRRMMLSDMCRAIEETAKETDPDIGDYIFEAVTNEDVTFTFLKMRRNIPCGKDMYYDRKKNFIGYCLRM